MPKISLKTAKQYLQFLEDLEKLVDPIEKILKSASHWKIDEIHEYLTTSKLQVLCPPIDEESELDFLNIIRVIHQMADEKKLTLEEENKLLLAIE